MFRERACQQTVGISMGTNCASFSYEADVMQVFYKNKKPTKKRLLTFTK